MAIRRFGGRLDNPERRIEQRTDKGSITDGLPQDFNEEFDNKMTKHEAMYGENTELRDAWRESKIYENCSSNFTNC